MDQPNSTSKAQPIYVIIAGIIIAIVTIAFLISNNDNSEPTQITEPSQPIEPEPIMVTEPEITAEPQLPSSLEANTIIENNAIEVAEIAPVSTQSPQAEMTEPVKTTPSLNESDGWLKQQMLDSFLTSSIATLLKDSDLVSNFVVFIDNAAQGTLATKFSPVNEPMSSFQVRPINTQALEVEYLVETKSFERYNLHTQLLTSLNSEQSLTLYQKVKPIINEAYQQLGYESDDFDDKLITAIDLLLDTPSSQQPTTLVTSSVMYEYKDTDLEDLYPIQKLLLRMGPNNQRKIQSALRNFKQGLMASN